MFFTPKPTSDACTAWGFVLPEPMSEAVTWYDELLRMAIGMTTLMIEFVLAGEISPKSSVTERLLSTLELPVTEPFNAPVIVGCPPLLISKFCATVTLTGQKFNRHKKIGITIKLFFIFLGSRNRKSNVNGRASVFKKLRLDGKDCRHRQTIGIASRNSIHNISTVKSSGRA